ncbi:MAG: C-terminal binding protein [Herpetosiphonaceae bacterium]|nr:C-terminal binding protein [Herpetosiphonaceae bacterium]
MKPLVILAYKEYPDTAVEAEVLSVLDARIAQITDFTTDDGTAAAREADALMVTTRPVSAELLQLMPRCRIISRVGTGVDAIDIEAATRQGIWVSNVPDYAIDEVSTHALTLLLAHARRLPALLDSTRQGIWDYRIVPPIVRLKGQTLGVVGFGRIARALAVKARGLGLNVLAYDRYVPDGDVEAEGVRPVSFETLLRESDFVSLHTPLTDATRGLIDSQALALMKPTAFLINTARGALVDEDALLAALREGHIAGAALDVLQVEPPPADHPLMHEPRAWLTPHIGWYSEAASREMRVKGAEEVVRVLRGGEPRSRINQIEAAPMPVRTTDQFVETEI